MPHSHTFIEIEFLEQTTKIVRASDLYCKLISRKGFANLLSYYLNLPILLPFISILYHQLQK